MEIEYALSCVKWIGSCVIGVFLGMGVMRVIVRMFPSVNSVPTDSDKEASY